MAFFAHAAWRGNKLPVCAGTGPRIHGNLAATLPWAVHPTQRQPGHRQPARGKVLGTRRSHSQPLSWLFLNGSTVPGGLADFSLSGLFSRSALKVQTTCFKAITKQRQPVRKQSAGEGKLELKKALGREKVARRSRWCSVSFPGRAAIAPH